jgi:hypothetical protein
VLLAVRNPSDPFCMLTAMQLTALRERFDRHRIRCYAICHQVDGINSFVDRFWSFTDAVGMPSLLIDENSALFPADVSDQTERDLAVERLRQVKPSYSFEPEGADTLLGGIVVVDPSKGVIYTQLEERVGTFLSDDGEALVRAIDTFYSGAAALYHAREPRRAAFLLPEVDRLVSWLMCVSTRDSYQSIVQLCYSLLAPNYDLHGVAASWSWSKKPARRDRSRD